MALAGFDSDYYLAAKLTALQAEFTEWADKDVTFLESVLTNAGLTAEEHYMQYGWSEGLAPNAYFDADEYVLAKATDMFNDGGYLSIQAAQDAFNAAWGMDPYEHYLAYGAAEGINPSNDFDASDYLAAKLAALQADADTSDEWAGKTVDDLEAAFEAAGLTALSHYVMYGEGEGLTAPVVPAGEQVSVGGGGSGSGDAEGFTLTTNTDALTGTSGDDTFTALVGTNAVNGNAQDTAQSFDSVNGGDGDDTINIQSNTAKANIGMTLGSVETINFTAFQAGVSATGNLNLTNATGVTTLNNVGSIATFVATNVGEVAVGIEDVNTQTTEISFGGTAWATLTDSATLNLDNVTNQSNVTMTGANDIETLNIVTSGSASKIDLGGTALDGTTKLVISGDQDLSFDDTDNTTAMAAIKTIDASAFEGKLDADLSNGGTVDLAITGSAQDDTFTVTNIDKDDNIDLGDGADKLTVKYTADASLTPTFTNVETLSVSAVGNDVDVSLNLSKSTSLTTAMIGADDGGDGDSVVLTQAGAALTDISFNAGGVTADTTLDALTFALASSTGTSDTLNLSYTNQDANGNLINSTKGVQLASTITAANGIETINITTDQLHPGTNATTQDGGVAITLTSTDKLSTLNITSETLVDLSGAALDDSVSVVDASNANGGVKLEMDNAANADLTSGTKSVTVTTGSGADTVNDIVGTVQTSVTTGAGNDTIALAGTDGASDLTKAVTINAGAGKDSIDLSGDSSAVTKTVYLGEDTDVDTVTILLTEPTAATDSQTGISIYNFTAGAGGDKIDFYANGANDGGVVATTFDGDGTTTDGAGLIVINGDVSQGAAATVAQIDAVQDIDTLTGFDAAGDDVYAVYDDGSNTYIALLTSDADGDASAGTDSLIVAATLVGVSDCTKLTVDNFSDFLG